VLLAPYGLAGSLTGVSYKSADHNIAKLIKDWERFYPLDRNKYLSRDSKGDFVSMPAAVEVVVAGVRFKYPTCYVLVTDMDGATNLEPTSNIAKAMHASKEPGQSQPPRPLL
jgi:mediator of RNA polymerase II transcription subunit 13